MNVVPAMNTLPDAILNYVITLMTQYIFLVPLFLFIIAIWRVARLRGVTWDNYREKVDTSVADTLKEQIDDRFLRPLLEQQGVQLPRGTQPMDLLDRLVQADPNNLNVLTTI